MAIIYDAFDIFKFVLELGKEKNPKKRELDLSVFILLLLCVGIVRMSRFN